GIFSALLGVGVDATLAFGEQRVGQVVGPTRDELEAVALLVRERGGDVHRKQIAKVWLHPEIVAGARLPSKENGVNAEVIACDAMDLPCVRRASRYLTVGARPSSQRTSGS